MSSSTLGIRDWAQLRRLISTAQENGCPCMSRGLLTKTESPRSTLIWRARTGCKTAHLHELLLRDSAVAVLVEKLEAPSQFQLRAAQAHANSARTQSRTSISNSAW
eukprot:400271-Pleurochrysis_carterae.AAC.1